MCCFLLHGVYNCLLIIFTFIDIAVLVVYSLNAAPKFRIIAIEDDDACAFYQSKVYVRGLCWLLLYNVTVC